MIKKSRNLKIDKTIEFSEISDEVGDVYNRVNAVGKAGRAVANKARNIGLFKDKNTDKR